MDFIHQLVDQLTQFFMDYGVWGLIFVSFADSSFFPVPPDFLFIPLAIARPELAFWYGLLTTATSVLGAVFGWWVGHKAGRPILYKFFPAEKVRKVEMYYQKLGGAALAVGGFTPLPYKAFTITAGMSNISLRDLILWSLLARGARFMIEALVIVYLGEAAQAFIHDYFGPLTIIAVIVVIIGYIAYRLYKSRKTPLDKSG